MLRRCTSVNLPSLEDRGTQAPCPLLLLSDMGEQPVTAIQYNQVVGGKQQVPHTLCLQELLIQAHTATEGPALTKLRSKLSAEEAALFAAGATSMAAFQRWRYSTSTAIRGPSAALNAKSKPRPPGPARPALQDIANRAAQGSGAGQRR